jgi:hypothetical protein
MKKIVFISTFLFFCSEVEAQNSYGVRVAYNTTNATKASEYIITANLNRFQFGVYGKLTMCKKFFLKGNLIYNQKGNIYNDFASYADAGKKVTIKLNYIETSVDLGYTFNLTKKQTIQLAAGPYLAYGLNGTEKGYGETIAGPVKIDNKVVFNNTKDYNGTNLQIKPIDAGLNFNVAYQYRKYGVFISYGLGLTNREKWGKSFNRVASIGVSYSFK